MAADGDIGRRQALHFLTRDAIARRRTTDAGKNQNPDPMKPR
jgi:hypothetical protein